MKGFKNMKKRIRSYSIRQYKKDGSYFNYSLKFYYNPRMNYKKAYTDEKSLVHAKKTLQHCRDNWPGIKFKIIRRIIIIEELKY